jgi:hypothetical protein
METRSIEKGDIKLTVSEATALIGMKRTRLKLEAERAAETDPDRHLLRMLTFPDVVSATVQAEGLEWPLDFETFVALPDQLVAKWEEAVYGLNPHWLPGYDEAAEKKLPSPSSGDSPSGLRRKRPKRI